MIIQTYVEWSYILNWNKETLHSEKNFPAIKFRNLQGKTTFLGTTTLDHKLFLCAAILLKFLCIVIAAVYKLIWWDLVQS